MKKLPTFHAPAEKSDRSELLGQSKALFAIPELTGFLNAVPEIYLVLNAHRQIVFANESLYRQMDIHDIEPVLGWRPGDFFGCIHSNSTGNGCGTTEHCRTCGTVNTIISSLSGAADQQEARIMTKTGDALDFKITTSPYTLKNDNFTIFTIQDISADKRRRALERIFFHDIINTAGGLQGIASLIKDAPLEIYEFKDMLFEQSSRLIEEILAQKDLTAAESHELSAQINSINSIDLINNVISLYENHWVAEHKTITLDPESPAIEFTSDFRLLRRVLGNILKNALEASGKFDTVTLGCNIDDSKIEFWVHNPGYIERDIQLQMFQRSFSTKSSDRGLGTYSMKLLSERYLKGSVRFISEIDKGTTFFASYPVSFQ